MTMTPSVEAASNATPREVLERHIMDSNIPKSETEWWAAHEIEQLREELAAALATPGFREGVEAAARIVSVAIDSDGSLEDVYAAIRSIPLPIPTPTQPEGAGVGEQVKLRAHLEKWASEQADELVGGYVGDPSDNAELVSAITGSIKSGMRKAARNYAFLARLGEEMWRDAEKEIAELKAAASPAPAQPAGDVERVATDLVDNACLGEPFASVSSALKRDIAQALRTANEEAKGRERTLMIAVVVSTKRAEAAERRIRELEAEGVQLVDTHHSVYGKALMERDAAEAEIARLKTALSELLEAAVIEVNEKGGGGFILARISDARAALATPTGEPT